MVVALLETEEMLARLDLELSQHHNAAAVERLMESAAEEWSCDCTKKSRYNLRTDDWIYYCCDSCCDYWDCADIHHRVFEPPRDDFSLDTMRAAYHLNGFGYNVPLEVQQYKYSYEQIEGLMQDFMGNDIYRGDKIAYATRRGNSATMVVAEYLEPANESCSMLWVKPLRQALWGGKGVDRTGDGYKSRVRVGNDNVLLLESK